MRNILFTYFVFFILLNFACQKQITQKENNQGQLTTVTGDIEGDSNSVSLSDASQIAVGFLQDRNPNGNFTVRSAETIPIRLVPHICI